MYTILYVILALIVIFIVYVTISLKKMKNAPAVAESNSIINLDEKNFQQTTKDRVVLVDFWAEWCMPCKMMTPILNDVVNEVDDKIKICKLNVDSQQQLASKYGVRSIPTLIILKNGKEVKRFVGVKPKDFLISQLNTI
ncbi:MAG: thioredoxin [bacterium]